MSVAELKAKGNTAFAAKDYEAAIQHYTDAIAAAKGPEDAVHVLYSNRSACYSGLKQYEKALEDADEVSDPQNHLYSVSFCSSSCYALDRPSRRIPLLQRGTDEKEARCTA